MDHPAASSITGLLRELRDGNRAALDQLVPLVYPELHRIASACLGGQRGHTLQPTALIHETYLRLVGRRTPDWQDRAHFFAVSATIMRQILVDHARASQAAKRGGGAVTVEFNDQLEYKRAGAGGELIALDDALSALAQFDERKAKVLELRFFAGSSVEETAEALGLSVATVGREARLAQAWLIRELSQE